MRTKIIKWVSIAILLLAAVCWNSAANYQLVLNVVVSSAAAVISVQAFREDRRRWAVVFLALALLFNPALPLFRFAGAFGLLLVALSIAAFAISLAGFEPQPLLSIASITDPNPRRQSL